MDIDKYLVVKVNSNEKVKDFYEDIQSFINTIEERSLIVKEHEIDINLIVGIS